MHFLANLCFYVLLPYLVAAVSDRSSDDEDRPPKRIRASNEDIMITISSENTTSSDEGLPEMYALWLEQKVDHSKLTNPAGTWEQRYFINKVYYTGTGPVILYIGGFEELIFSVITENGPWLDYASRTKALLVAVEHRYFGESRPVDDLKTENLIYLTIEQALADLGYLIKRIQEQYSKYIPSKAKWIALGGSYAGMLAARLKLKFPHLVHAAVASSAPLLEIVNFKGYYEYVEKEAAQYAGAKATIKNAFRMIHEAIDTHDVNELKNKFNMCSLISINNAAKNEELFYLMLTHFVAQALEMGDVIMNILVKNMSSNSIDRLASVVRLLLLRNKEKCLLVDYDTTVENYKVDEWDSIRRFTLQHVFGNRQNLYQYCTEIGQFSTSEQEDSLFGEEVKIEFYTKFCEDVFGKMYNLALLEEGVERANIYYGGLDIQVSRVLFVNGVLDKNYQLKVTGTDILEDRIAINIKNVFPMDDLAPSKNPLVQRAQKKIFDILDQWLLQ